LFHKCIDILKSTCGINKEATYKGVIDGYGGNFHLYFTKEESTDTYYISSWLNLDSPKKIILTVDEKQYNIDVLPFNIRTIVDVTSIIKEGKKIYINVPDYKFTDMYEMTSDMSLCEIYDRNIIKNIDTYAQLFKQLK
jgi:hypothetical protein